MSGAAMVALEMLAAGLWMLWAPHDSRRYRLFGLIWLVCFYGLASKAALHFEDLALPLKMDGSLYALDKALGITSFPLARVLLDGWPGVVISEIYVALLPVVVAWFAMSLIVWNEAGMLWALLIEMVAAPCLYALVPACGPAYAFPNFPAEPLFSVPASLRITADPNAMPSIHVATALLLFLFARGKWWRFFSLVFLAGTAISTLASGEHYVVDLIVAVPFACFVHATVRKRIGAATLYGGVVLGWILMIRAWASSLIEAPGALRLSALITLMLGATYVLFGAGTKRLPWPNEFGESRAVVVSEQN